ncbi:MAG: hypothetical protein PUD22_00240 [Erysipelotrichaceae bacterium]|nr:hypothetical protein [Erysipelotrichaceae bacterium]
MKYDLTEEKIAAFLEGRLSSYERDVISNLIDSDEILSSLISDIKEIDTIPLVSKDDHLGFNENIELPNIDSLFVEENLSPNFSLFTYDLDPSLLLFPGVEVTGNLEFDTLSNEEQVNLCVGDYDGSHSLLDTDSLTPVDDSIDINSQGFQL